jgi:hypothetical protein
MPFLTDTSATSGADRKCVRTANGSRIFSSHVGYLNRHNMSKEARRVYIFPDLDINLMSYTQFLDTGHQVHLTPTTATVTNIISGDIVESAVRTIGGGLFYHQLAPPTSSDTISTDTSSLSTDIRPLSDPTGIRPYFTANTLVHNISAVQRARYFVQLFCNKPTSTLLKAVRKGWLTEFRGLTAAILRLLPFHMPGQAAGHLDAARKNRASTKNMKCHDFHCDDETEDECAPGDAFVVRFVSKEDMQRHEQTMYSDMPGRLQGQDNTYSDSLIVCLNNYTHSEWMANGTGAELLRAFRSAVRYFALHKRNIYKQVMDNAAPQTLRDEVHRLGHQLHFVPPNVKRCNISERKIRYFKNTVIGARYSADKDFPFVARTKECMPHIDVVQNTLCPCSTDPTISAYQWLHGEPYQFNRWPMMPIGWKLTVFQPPKSTTRASWDDHGIKGYYCGPLLDHYRCVHVYIPATNRMRMVDTVEAHPEDIILPGATDNELLTAAMGEFIQRIDTITSTGHKPTQAPIFDDLMRLRAILQDRQEQGTPNPDRAMLC